MKINNTQVRPKNFTLILYKEASQKSEKAYRVETKSKRRFSTRLKLLPPEFYGYLRVSYTGGGWNEGIYKTKGDLIFAYKAFIEN